LFQAAAVIGKDVALSLLLTIADAPEHQVCAGLSRLQEAEFRYENRLSRSTQARAQFATLRPRSNPSTVATRC
jgi:hypothetical protein